MWRHLPRQQRGFVLLPAPRARPPRAAVSRARVHPPRSLAPQRNRNRPPPRPTPPRLILPASLRERHRDVPPPPSGDPRRHKSTWHTATTSPFSVTNQD